VKGPTELKRLLTTAAIILALTGGAFASDCKVGMAEYNKLKSA